MKCVGPLTVLLVLCLACSLAEPKRKLGGSSRKTSTSGRRPTSNGSNGGSYGNGDLASLSYSGYNSAPKKPQSTGQSTNTQNYGWNVNNAPKKETAPVQTSANQQHSYPSSGGLSGTSGAKPNTGHAYPPSNGASGASGQQHAYPQSTGLSGGQHTYPQNQGGLSGTGQHVQSSNANPTYNNPYNKPPVNNAQPPPYSANNPHGAPPAYGAPGYGNHPPPYGAPGYGAPGYGGHPPSYGGAVGGYGGHPPQYGGYGGFGGYGGQGGYNSLGSSGGFGGFAGLNNYGYQRKSGFLSSNTFGAILAGLAVWNLVRSGSKTTNNYHYYGSENNKGDPKALPPDPIVDQLVNCTLTINNNDKTEVTLIPCVIVSSFALNAAATSKGPDANGLNCMITLIFKNSTEKMVNMPCEELSNKAPPENAGGNQTNCDPNSGNCPPLAQALYEAPPLSVIPLSVPSTPSTEGPSTTTSASSVDGTTSESSNSTEASSTLGSTSSTAESTASTTEATSSTTVSTSTTTTTTESSATTVESATTKSEE